MKFTSFDDLISSLQGLPRRKKQTILVVLLAALGLILITGALLTMAKNRQFTTFQSQKYNLSIDYPRAWQLHADVPGGVAAVFVSPKESALDVFQENVSIIVQDLTGRTISIRAYGQEAEMQMKGLFKETLEVEYSGPTFAAGMDGYKFVYHGTNQLNPSTNLKGEHLFFLKGEKAYQLNYVALTSKFDKYSDLFDKMVASFKLK